MPQSAKEFTDITALIKLILNGYPGNSAIFREYLQNADDAKARLQLFILDERCHSMDSLVDEVLKGAQGAALLAVNDGVLRESDWMALRKINSSSKQTDESQTGKNGLGFRASYHLTENPHIISGRTLMILDPHHEFKEHPGGISIDVIDEGEEYKDQITPFIKSIEGMQTPYTGTAFRLPLRTQTQADRSKIKTTATSVQDMVDVLNEFARNELEEVILFLKHITAIEIHHTDSAGNKVSFAKVTIDPIPVPCPATLIRRTTVTSFDGKSTSRDWKFHYATHTKALAKALMDSRLGYNIGDNLTLEKLLPTVDIALPLDGSPIRGRLFTLLPFPQYTNFPIHLNAVFALDTSRQNLKNIREVGVANSRERRLVEWNKVIFDTWTPELWADLLAGLTPEALKSANWSLWPPREIGEDCYWSGLAAAFVRTVHSRNLAVFPTVDLSRLVRVSDPNVLLASSNPGISLSLLSALGVDIVQPPTHIFNLLISGNYGISQLSPQSLHRVLERKTHFEECTDSDLKTVEDYLVFSSNTAEIKYIAGLRWFRCAKDGGRVCLDLAGNTTGTKYFIPQTETEARIFVEHAQMLAWSTFSDRLRTHLSNPSTSRALKVAVLDPGDVVSFLKRRLIALQSTGDEISNVGNDYDYIIYFWSWIVGWSKSPQFFSGSLGELSALFLLPTSREGSLRKLSSQVIHFSENDLPFVKAWSSLGIYPISSRIPDSVVSKLRSASIIPAPRTWPQISYLVKNSNLASSPDPRTDFVHIRTYLSENLPRSGSSLTAENKARLKRFPIFMTKDSQTAISSLGTIDGHCIYVDIEDGLPLPRLRGYPNVIFVDAKDLGTLSFVRLIESNVTIRNQTSILQLAIDDWDLQLSESKDIFIDRIFAYRPSQLPSSLLQSLQRLPFVVVNDLAAHMAPINLIHPRSSLAALYRGEPGKMPAGRFAEQTLLSVMQDFGFIRASLDAHIVQDRLRYLTDPSSSGDAFLFEKATKFTDLLNREWNSTYGSIVMQYRSHNWLPLQGPPRTLVSPSQSRDNHRDDDSHPYFFDRVLTSLPIIFIPQFREALGWSTMLPSTVLIAQLVATIDRRDNVISSNRSNRLVRLLSYLNNLFEKGNLSQAVLEDLRASVRGRGWIPSNSSNEFLVETHYALLSDTSLKGPFQSIYHGLARLPLLCTMGCTHRPPMDLLVTELNRICDGPSSILTSGAPFSSNLRLESALAILQEIADHHHDKVAQSGIKIPGDDQHAHPLSDVYFRDAAPIDIPATLRGKFAAHNKISVALAQTLGIPLLSSLMLGYDEDEDEEQMDTDFVTVVKQFLSDYDPQYAFNEFLANAVDARATKFTLLLDERRNLRQDGHVISPKFQRLFTCETLLLHNDAKLTPGDFKGIRRVGRGGKREDLETHGRHGLGALSLYYFTDVATIISGDTVMILNPSSNYLPPFPSGRKRTSIVKKISDLVAMYPGQLRRYESLFGFSSQNSQYEGTLFCLPLCGTITEKACTLGQTREYLEGSYRQLASVSLLFTALESITANACRAGSTKESVIWSFSASRAPDRDFGNVHGFKFHDLKIEERDRDIERETNWIITTFETDQIPDAHLRTARAVKLPSIARVQLAINIHAVESESFLGYPFSMVPLPRSITLPFHVNARFAISSNRQDLVLNSADGGGNKDAHTMFNTWLLESLVAPLYLETLQHAGARQYGRELKSSKWWLAKCSDSMSQIITQTFLKALPVSEHKIFKSVNGSWISFCESVFSKSEPSYVARLLTDLRTPKYLKSSRYRHIAQIEGATVVTPTFVRGVLLDNADFILSRDDVPTAEDCRSILDYLEKGSSLIGVPILLITSNERIRIPDASQPPVYFSDKSSHATLFSSSQFLGPGYSIPLIKGLLDDTAINVVALAGDNVNQLIAMELQQGSVHHRAQWIRNFWAHYYNTLPGPPSISTLLSTGLPLIESTSDASPVPLSHCIPSTVVYNTGLEEGLVDILTALRIEIVNDSRNAHLKKFLTERFKGSVLSNILQCIFAKGVAVLDILSHKSRNKLSHWIQDHLSSTLTEWGRDVKSMPISMSNLLSLPIWDVYCNGNYRRDSSTHLNVLPSHFPMDAIVPYLKRDTPISPWSSLLSRFLELFSTTSKNSQNLSASGILSIVNLPATITTRVEINDLKRFMESMSKFPDSDLISSALTVPDSDGTLRPVHELYDDRVGLFLSTLKLTKRPSFIHPEFKTLRSQLKKLGLVHEITLETFRHCANAVSDAVREHGPSSDNWNVVRQMSAEAFSAYQYKVPALLLNRSYSWSSLDQISFVQRKTVRRQGVSYHIRDKYVAENLPLILPPSRFVLPAHEPIAWTQRALFLTEPADGLVTVNKTLGIPEANEVVAHLVLLTTVIAIDHPGNPTLLSDIKATYTWLQNHASGARFHLLQVGDKKLFLNVDDPTNESWTGNWTSANELVLNMEYDQGPLKCVRGFLKPFEALLRTAGCEEIKTSVGRANPSSAMSSGQSWKAEFNRMRKANEFTDVTLVPTSERVPTEETTEDDETVAGEDVTPATESEKEGYDEPGGVRIERSELRAHRIILAAAIPYLRTLQKWTATANVSEISFYGSAFAAKAVIDFVYTGEIELSTEKTGKEDLSIMMRNLLEVLPVADEWDMQDLKEKVQWELVSKHRVVQRLPEEYDTLLDYATRHNADKIAADLKELAPIRARMQRLREAQN